MQQQASMQSGNITLYSSITAYVSHYKFWLNDIYYAAWHKFITDYSKMI